MATTDNYKLAQLELTNSANFPLLLNNTFKTIDKGLTLDVGISTGIGNNYILNLGSITLTSANKGISFKFWADKDSKGAVTINGTYKLIKAGGSSITNLKKGAPYTITYDGGTNFFLASGGGANTVNFTSDKLLTGYSANDSNGEKVNGTMPNKGAVTASLNCGGSYTIPEGYHNGSGKVTANSLSSQTSANATAKDIIKGKTAWVNGSKITGTATIQSLGGMLIQEGSTTATYTNGSWFINLSGVLKFTPKILFGYLPGLSNYGQGTFVLCNGYVDNLSFKTKNKSSNIEITAPMGDYLKKGAECLADLSNIEISVGGDGTTRTCKWVAIG